MNPINIFRENRAEARLRGDPSADYCTLATVSEDGQASTRTLVLREVTERGFVVFVNATSPKWQQLTGTNQPEMLVFWPSLMQQYRIRGELEIMPEAKIRHHWSKKPHPAKLVDHFYRDYHSQSSTLDTRDTLVEGLAQLESRYPAGADIPFPGNARGVTLKAKLRGDLGSLGRRPAAQALPVHLVIRAMATASPGSLISDRPAGFSKPVLFT